MSPSLSSAARGADAALPCSRDLYVPGGPDSAVAHSLGCTRANMNFIIEGVYSATHGRPIVDMEFRVPRPLCA